LCFADELHLMSLQTVVQVLPFGMALQFSSTSTSELYMMFQALVCRVN